MSARTKLSTLRQRVVSAGVSRIEHHIVNPGTSSRRDQWDFIAPNGRILFSVMPQDLHDADGNYFEDDL